MTRGGCSPPAISRYLALPLSDCFFVQTIFQRDGWPISPELLCRSSLYERGRFRYESYHRVAPHQAKEIRMDLLTLALVALVISIIAGLFGFTGIASGAAAVAKVVFGIFLVIAVVVFLLIVLGVGLVL
jgi:uncharacterized membrane protein YtjA (UPF0391 family)